MDKPTIWERGWDAGYADALNGHPPQSMASGYPEPWAEGYREGHAAGKDE